MHPANKIQNELDSNCVVILVGWGVKSMSEPEFEYLGPYRVERTLGRGGMGSVYKGVHTRSGQAIAIKVIAGSVANSPRFRRRFAAEVETLQRLKHPNIVELVGFGEEQGLLFYTMEYVDGHSLHDHLRANTKMPWQEAVQVGIETAAALKHAHDLGIIHRDLKPANLMLSTDGQIKLTDFGIAKLFGGTDLTAVGSVIGTADYMPPEQAEGKPVTVRSDLYSLGGVLYALTCGKAPFGGKSVPEVLYSVRYNAAPDLLEREPEVPTELAELVHEMLDKNPQRRPPTALVVGNRLKSILHGYSAKGDTAKRAIDLGSAAAGKAVEDDHAAGTSMRKMGTHLTSLDLSDIEDDEVQLTGADINDLGLDHGGEGQDEPPSVERPIDTHEQQTMVAPDGMELPPAKHASGSALGRRESEFSGEFREMPLSEESITSGGPSHYTPVEEADSKPFAFPEDEPEKKVAVDWLQIGSIAGIIATLLGCVALGWYLLQPGSAEDLYDTIVQAADSGDDSQLVGVQDEIELFLSRFPEDERVVELQALSDDIELARWTRVLRRKAGRTGGEAGLTAIEQAFLDCMEIRDRDTAVAEPHLRAFLSVFGAVENLPGKQRRYVELADYALRVGASRKEVLVPVAAEELEKLIQSADKALSGDDLATYYKDLLTLYGDKPWASEQIERLKRKLESDL